jgi:hypothetical protein
LVAIPGVAILASFRGRDRVGGPGWALIHLVDRLKSPFDKQLFCRIAHEKFDSDRHLPLFLSALEGIPLAIKLLQSATCTRTLLVFRERRVANL